jgi:hypothetical protein
MKYYPDNRVTQYTTRLQTTIELTGEWEAALVEMMFTKTWYTIPMNSGKFTYSCMNCLDKERHLVQDYDPTLYAAHIEIPYGYYATPEDLVNVMNDAVENKLKNQTFPVYSNGALAKMSTIDGDKWPRFKYDDIKKKIQVYIQPEGTLTFDPYFAHMLGMETNTIENQTSAPKTMSGMQTFDIEGGVHALYVYCDVLENVPVGDTEAPLLRAVEATGKMGENVHRTFDPPRYIPVQKKHFDSILVYIRTDTGEPVPFEGGKVVASLHFRRATSSYFSK